LDIEKVAWRKGRTNQGNYTRLTQAGDPGGEKKNRERALALREKKIEIATNGKRAEKSKKSC